MGDIPRNALKKLIWKFSQEAYSRNFSRVSLTCETIMKLSVQISWLSFTREIFRK